MSNSTATTKTKFVSSSNQFGIFYYYEGSSYHASPKDLSVGMKIRTNHNASSCYRVVQKISNKGEHFFLVERESETKDEKENPTMLLLGYKESDPSFEIARVWFRRDFTIGRIVEETQQYLFNTGYCMNGHKWYLYGNEPSYTLGFLEMKSMLVLNPIDKFLKTKSTYLRCVDGSWGVWTVSSEGMVIWMELHRLEKGMVIINREVGESSQVEISLKCESEHQYAFWLQKKSQLLILPKKGSVVEYLITVRPDERVVGNACHFPSLSNTREYKDINGNYYKRISDMSATPPKFYYEVADSPNYWCTKLVAPEDKIDEKMNTTSQPQEKVEVLLSELASVRLDFADLRKSVYELTQTILKGQQTLIKGQNILQETLEVLVDDSDLQQMIADIDELDLSDPAKDESLFADRVRRLITDSLIAVIKINTKPTIHDIVKEINDRLS